MKPVCRWENKTARRCALVVIIPIATPIVLVYGAYIGAKRAVGQLVDAVCNSWKGIP